ncbi:MAG TPA: toast rack family protein [Acidobacteriota bacterium]|nr:toast rack family protein [Acidobacteriota bacterium]
MNLRSAIARGLAAALVSVGLVLAGDVETVTELVDGEGAENIVVECEFGAGELSIRSGDIAEVVSLEISETPRWVRHEVDYYKRGNTGYLRLESDLRRGRVHDDLENEWNLTLSTRYPLKLDMEIGACEAEFDLGGLPITELHLEVGATSGKIDFSKPNKEELRDFSISTGASSLEIYNLGNANFERLEFEAGASSCVLDFHGEFSGEAVVEVDVGVGSVDIDIPSDMAVRIETDEDSWFSSVDFKGLRLESLGRGIYESRGFDDADDRLIFVVDVGLGSVDFHGRR